VKSYLGNQRQGTHATKTRSFVSGGNQKPWRQKGTGRARQGSTRAPNWPGGGKVFGPSPRDYRTEIPRKVKQLARQSALNARASDGGLVVIEPLEFTEPKTARLVELLGKLGGEGRKTLVLTHGTKPAVYLSGRNVGTVKVMTYPDASAYDVLWSELVVVEEGVFSGEPPAPPVYPEGPVKQAPAPRKPAAKAPAKAKAEPKKKPAAKAAAKAKKPAAKKKKKGGK